MAKSSIRKSVRDKIRRELAYMNRYGQGGNNRNVAQRYWPGNNVAQRVINVLTRNERKRWRRAGASKSKAEVISAVWPGADPDFVEEELLRRLGGKLL